MLDKPDDKRKMAPGTGLGTALAPRRIIVSDTSVHFCLAAPSTIETLTAEEKRTWSCKSPLPFTPL